MAYAQSIPVGSRAKALALSCRVSAKAATTAKPLPAKACRGISPRLKALAHPPPLNGGGVFLKIHYLVGHTFSHIRESIKEDGVFHSIGLVFFCCLVLFSFSLRRFWAFVALFGGFRRFSAGGRLLPHRLSLCFLLRRVGFIIVLRWSSSFFLLFFIDVWGFFIDVWGYFIDIKFGFSLHISVFFRNFAL